MERIVIVGCSGGGKSTLARAIGERLALPVIHLDTLFWKPGWVESDPDTFRTALDAAVAGSCWVSDGNFSKASSGRFSRADTVIWIERPMLQCLWRACRRAILAFGRTRPDLAPGCPEKIDLAFYAYIWSWNRVTRPKIEAAIETFAPTAERIHLRSDDEVTRFLSKLN